MTFESESLHRKVYTDFRPLIFMLIDGDGILPTGQEDEFSGDLWSVIVLIRHLPEDYYNLQSISLLEHETN